MKFYQYDLFLTTQGDRVRVETWRTDDYREAVDFQIDVLGILKEHLEAFESEGDWGFEMVRTEVPAPEDGS